MSHLRRLLLALLAVLVLVRPGNGCSFSDDDLTPSGTDPDRPYSAFLDGRLGIASGQLRIRHLVVAYDILSGRGLTPSEQKAAIDVDQFYNYNGGVGPEVPSPLYSGDQQKVRAEMQAWFAAAQNTPTRSEHAVPGEDYSSFTNCLDDAYVHAANTLADLRKRYGKPLGPNADPASADTPEIAEWIAGQVNVFANCSDNPYQAEGSYQKGPPPLMPQPLPASAPLWLRQARAYQIAAADFYALRYDKALDEFNEIAADKGSPYATLSRYVVGRVLIRRAVVPYRFSGTPEQAAAQKEAVLTGLAQARDYLQTLLRDPAMASYHTQSQHLLDYVMVRLDPAAQADELARRLSAPPRKTSAATPDLDTDYRQNVIDLTYAYNSLPLYSPAFPGKDSAPVEPKSPLLRWINDLTGQINPDIGATVNRLYSRDPAAHAQDALALWRSTNQPQWLAAALIDAQPGSLGVADLIEAARAVLPNSPAWATDTYRRLRLQYASEPRTNAPDSPSVRYNEVAALMPAIERTQPRSTMSLFADLESSLTPTLELFLKTAPRITAHTIQEEPGEGFTASGSNLEYAASQTPVTLCGVNLNTPDTPHFDASVALIFNQRMSLRLLSEAALSPALPNNLRFQLAHMVWTRALLLDDAATARALAPYLAQCQPAFKTWLDQYNAAKTSDERHVLGLLSLMRFTSTEPTVRVGGERDFAAYDYSRDNWWCDADNSGQTYPPQPKPALLFSQPLVPIAAQPNPPFLTPADRTAADHEIAELQKIPCASDYFAQQALDWVKAHPSDARNSDVLGFAMRVVRNACRSDATKELNHQLFDTLHSRYPKSEWATRYTTWE